MTHTSDRYTRRAVLGQVAGCALFSAIPASARAALPKEPLISLWEHDAKVDIAPVVKQVGFNTVWTGDKPYDGKMKLEDTLMWRHMQTPGIKYVIAKIDRGTWGWSFDQAMRHAEWIAALSKTHKQIIGLYMNDLYDEMANPANGGHTASQFRQIIAKARSVNPRLPIWAPCYPKTPGMQQTNELEKPYNFDLDAIVFNIHFNIFSRQRLNEVNQALAHAEKKFAGRSLMTSFYITAGVDTRPLTEPEFNLLLDLFVKHINEGKTAGLRIFRAAHFLKNPEYMKWASRGLANLKRRG